MVTPDPRIAAYIAEISQPGVPYVSNSHGLLVDAYRAHGCKVIEQLLDDYFAALRQETKGATAPLI